MADRYTSLKRRALEVKLYLRREAESYSMVEVSDCDILRHHDSRIMTYHDCENYHDCHILQIFGTNKQAVVYTIYVTVLF